MALGVFNAGAAHLSSGGALQRRSQYLLDPRDMKQIMLEVRDCMICSPGARTMGDLQCCAHEKVMGYQYRALLRDTF